MITGAAPSQRPTIYAKRSHVSLGRPVPVVSVLVPVYNEAATVAALVERVDSAAVFPVQIIVVDDGSTDQAWRVLREGKWLKGVELVRHVRNRGKGAAIRTGLARARGRFVIIQDGDLEYSPEDYTLLLEPLLAGKADVLYGSRYLGKRAAGQPWCFRAGVCTLNLCVHVLYAVRVTDEATCYKVFPTEALRAMDLECERFEFCPEVTAKAMLMGLRIVEVPIRYTPRTRREGKKIRWRDGLVALWTLWPWRNWRPPVDVRRQLEGGASAWTTHCFEPTGQERSAAGDRRVLQGTERTRIGR